MFVVWPGGVFATPLAARNVGERIPLEDRAEPRQRRLRIGAVGDLHERQLVVDRALVHERDVEDARVDRRRDARVRVVAGGDRERCRPATSWWWRPPATCCCSRTRSRPSRAPRPWRRSRRASPWGLSLLVRWTDGRDPPRFRGAAIVAAGDRCGVLAAPVWGAGTSQPLSPIGRIEVRVLGRVLSEVALQDRVQVGLVVLEQLGRTSKNASVATAKNSAGFVAP